MDTSWIVGLTSGLLSGSLIAFVSWTIHRRQSFFGRRDQKTDLYDEKINELEGLSGDVEFCKQHIGEFLAEVEEARLDIENDPGHDLTPLGFNEFSEFSNFSLSSVCFSTDKSRTERQVNELRLSIKKFKSTLKDLLSKSTDFDDIHTLVADLRHVQANLVEFHRLLRVDISVLVEKKSNAEKSTFNLLGKNQVV